MIEVSVNSLTCNGKELNELLSEITTNTQEWEIKRSSRRNSESIIKHLLVCARVTNSSIGSAINQNANHILTVSRFKFIEPEFLVEDILEIIYKNDIFVISLGDRWLFKTSIGKKMLAVVLNNSNSSIWRSNIDTDNLFIGMKEHVQLNSIFSRLRNCIYYYPAKFDEETRTVSNLLIIRNSFTSLFIDEHPDVLITLELTSSLITYCYYNDIILVFVHTDNLYTEIARELRHIIMNSLGVRSSLCSGLIFKNEIK